MISCNLIFSGCLGSRRYLQTAGRASVRLLLGLVALVACSRDIDRHVGADGAGAGVVEISGARIDQLLERSARELERGEAAQASSLAEEALAAAVSAGDGGRTARAHLAVAAGCRELEDAAGELTHGLAGLAAYERSKDRLGAAEAQRRLVSYYLLIDLETARRYAETALVTFRELGDRRGIAEATGNLGQIEFESGNSGRALALFEEARARARELGDPVVEAANLSRMSYAYWKLGRPAEMLDMLEQAMAIVGPSAGPRVSADLLTDLGLAKLELGRFAEARRDLEEGLRLAERAGATSQQITTLGYLSKAQELLGDESQALATERLRNDLYMRRFSDRLRQQIATEQSHSDLDRLELEAERLRRETLRRSWMFAGVGGALLLFALAASAVAWVRHRAARKVEAKSDVIERQRRELESLVATLRDRDQRVFRINQIHETLLACATSEEAYLVVARMAPEILAGESGALAIVQPGGASELDVVARWGEESGEEGSLTRDDCWAIRRGQPYEVADLATGLGCPHARVEEGIATACIPLVVRGDLLGVLLLRRRGGASDLGSIALRGALAEALKLGLSNLVLRRTLEEQAVRDPLTGLFNRRFLEISLPREIDRARRQQRPLACAILDLDGFKRVNDQFGHDAGDQVLREIGRILRSSLRSSDLACRYGGDELVVVMPDSDREPARERLEEIRRKIAGTRLLHLGRSIGAVSASVGLAAVPAGGGSASDLLRTADRALLLAKEAGRDRVVVAEEIAETGG